MPIVLTCVQTTVVQGVARNLPQHGVCYAVAVAEAAFAYWSELGDAAAVSTQLKVVRNELCAVTGLRVAPDIAQVHASIVLAHERRSVHHERSALACASNNVYY